MPSLFRPFAAACALTVAAVSGASAHAGLERGEAQPGSYKAVIQIPHGCDGKPTHTVRVELPEGFVEAAPMPKPGWDLDIGTRQAGSGTGVVTWSTGSLEDAHYDEFVIFGRIEPAAAGKVLAFPTTQLCDGAEVAWIDIPGEAGGEAPAHPAPLVRVAAVECDPQTIASGSCVDLSSVAVADIELSGAWARPMLPGQPGGAGYLSIINRGDEADRLIGASSPWARRVEIHTMAVVNDVMTMRPVEKGLELAAGDALRLEPGGLHLMFMEVRQPFAEGDKVPVTLEFENAGPAEVLFEVRRRDAPTAAHGHGSHHEH